MKKVSKLKLQRVKAGLTQREVAERLGCAQSLVSRWESRDRASPFWLPALQELFRGAKAE